MAPDSTEQQTVLFSADPGLRDEVRRLGAACGADVQAFSDLAGVRRCWRQAPAVVVGADRLTELAQARLPRRDRVVVVGFGSSEGWWRGAVEARAERVVALPGEQEQLVQVLTEVADGGARESCAVAVVGAGGGAGASTLAAAWGLVAAARGEPAMLVDLDVWGAGADLLLGGEHVDGLRWRDLASSYGRLGAGALRAALPSVDGLPVLTYARTQRTQVAPAAVQSVLDAGTRACDVVLVDVPRSIDDAVAEALALVDTVVVVTSPAVCSASAAVQVVEAVRHWCSDVRLAVRTGRRHSAAGVVLAEQMGVPLLGTIPDRPRVTSAVDDGLGPLRGTRLRRPVERLADARQRQGAA